MNWTQIIQNNFAAIIGVCGTLIGALVGIGGTLLTQHLLKKSELNLKVLEWQKEFLEQQIYKPMVSYVDNILSTMSQIRTYPLRLDNKISYNEFILNRIKEVLRNIDTCNARILSLDDYELTKIFGDIGDRLVNITENHMKENYSVSSDIKEVVNLASKLFNRLQPQVKHFMNDNR